MLSRVADSLYWMSRYLERAESTARIVSVHLNLEAEQPADASFGRWARVLLSLGQDPETAREMSASSLVHSMCFDPESRYSIVYYISAARENARQVREQISSEMWEQLNRLFHQVRRPGQEESWKGDPSSFLSEVRDGAYLFQGITDTTMSHGEGWQFIQLGRFLERAAQIANLVDVHFTKYAGDRAMGSDAGPDAADYMEWIGLLKCVTAFEAYSKVYTASISIDRVAEFLILDDTFPHSLRFSTDMVQAALSAIGTVAPSRRSAKVQRLAGRLLASLSFSQIDEIMAGGVHSLLTDLRRQCAAIHSGVFQSFISYPVDAALEA